MLHNISSTVRAAILRAAVQSSEGPWKGGVIKAILLHATYAHIFLKTRHTRTQAWCLFLIWINCNSSMVMLSKTRQSEGWDCLSFPKFQWLHCWSFGMDTQFFPRFANAVITYPWWDDCWSMLIKGTSDQQALSFKEWFGVDQNIWIKFLWILVDDILGFLKRMKTMGTQWYVVFNCESYQYGAVDTMDCNFECWMEKNQSWLHSPSQFWMICSKCYSPL